MEPPLSAGKFHDKIRLVCVTFEIAGTPETLLYFCTVEICNCFVLLPETPKTVISKVYGVPNRKLDWLMV